MFGYHFIFDEKFSQIVVRLKDAGAFPKPQVILYLAYYSAYQRRQNDQNYCLQYQLKIFHASKPFHECDKY